MDLSKDQVVLVTGGARGIGKETARMFLDNGACVMIADFHEQAGRATCEELNAPGRIEFVRVDVTSAEQVQAMVSQTLGRFGRIDVLVNNAGITIDGLLAKMEDDAWDKVISVNLSGVYKCTKAVLPSMLGAGYGVVLNASSVVALYGNVGQTNYAATKAGVIGLTKTWAKELGPKGIRVNAVAPGFITTDMTAKIPQKILDLMESKTPLQRLGSPRDIAAAYVFLASDYASFINGAVLSVDGGMSI